VQLSVEVTDVKVTDEELADVNPLTEAFHGE
jgi:hypothetical protein